MDGTVCVVIKPRFGIRAYRTKTAAFGACLSINYVGKMPCTSLLIDIGKFSYVFGWQIVPALGDGGVNLL
jgi:hypothetical protein